MDRFPVVSIRSEDQLEAAQSVIDELFGRGEPDAQTVLYLDALGDLVAAYEDAHHRIGPATDAEMLRHLREAQGVTQAELHKATGLPNSSISEVLAEKKPSSRAVVRALAWFFEADAAALAANTCPDSPSWQHFGPLSLRMRNLSGFHQCSHPTKRSIHPAQTDFVRREEPEAVAATSFDIRFAADLAVPFFDFTTDFLAIAFLARDVFLLRGVFLPGGIFLPGGVIGPRLGPGPASAVVCFPR